MTPQTYSIYSNPAVIALNQDPAVSAGIRVWRYFVPDIDEYGQGEISLWTRTLANGDIAVALVNAGNNSRMMNASLGDIFFDSGALRSPQAMETWDIYDLWANRMDDDTAASILSGGATINGTVINSMNSTSRYNATMTSYAEGLAMNSTALYGSMIGSVAPMGILNSMVPRHGVGLFRLRKQSSGTMKKRDEL